VVAAAPIFSVVTVAFRRLNVVAVDVISPPLTAKSPVSVRLLNVGFDDGAMSCGAEMIGFPRMPSGFDIDI